MGEVSMAITNIYDISTHNQPSPIHTLFVYSQDAVVWYVVVVVLFLSCRVLCCSCCVFVGVRFDPGRETGHTRVNPCGLITLVG